MTLNTHEEAVTSTSATSLKDGAPRETPSLLSLTTEAATLGRSFLELLLLELRLAAQAVPKIIGLTIIALILSVFAWLAFSTGVAWVSAVLFHSTGWGIAAFLAMQLLALFMCLGLASRYSKRLTLPNSRNFIKQIEDGFNAPKK